MHKYTGRMFTKKNSRHYKCPGSLQLFYSLSSFEIRVLVQVLVSVSASFVVLSIIIVEYIQLPPKINSHKNIHPATASAD